MGVFSGPTARIHNWIKQDVVCLVEMDELGFTMSKKRIVSGGFEDVGYRRAIDQSGPPICFLVVPENRPDVLPGRKILPIELFEYSDIYICYKLPDGSVTQNYQVGAAIHFQFRRATAFRRIGLVRYATGVCDSLITAFGNCCSAGHVANPGEIAGHASGPVEASLAVVVAPGPASDPIQAPLALGDAPGPASDTIQAPLALGDAPGPASAPGPSTSLSLGEALGEAPGLAPATEPSNSFNMVEALGQASPALVEALGQTSPAPALHVGIDIPSAAQVAAPATPSEISVIN